MLKIRRFELRMWEPKQDLTERPYTRVSQTQRTKGAKVPTSLNQSKKVQSDQKSPPGLNKVESGHRLKRHNNYNDFYLFFSNNWRFFFPPNFLKNKSNKLFKIQYLSHLWV